MECFRTASLYFVIYDGYNITIDLLVILYAIMINYKQLYLFMEKNCTPSIIFEYFVSCPTYYVSINCDTQW